MTDITRDVDFTVNVGDRVITAAGFGVLGLAAAHIKTRARVTSFSSVADAGSLFGTVLVNVAGNILTLTDPVISAVTAAFAQKSEAGSLEKIKILRQLVKDIDVELPTASATDRGDVLTFTITAVAVDDRFEINILEGANPPSAVDVIAGDTPTSVAAALVAEINSNDGAIVTAAAVGGGVFTITHDIGDTSFPLAAFVTNVTNGPTTLEATYLTMPMTIAGGYTINFDGILFATTSDSGDTATSIMTNIAAAINTFATNFPGGALPISVTDGADGTAEFTIDPTGIDFLTFDGGGDFINAIVAGGANFALLSRGGTVYHIQSSTETIEQALQAAIDVDNDFYDVTSLSAVLADIQSLATSVSTRKKIHGYSSQDVNVLDPAVSVDVASTLKTLGFDRTYGLFSNGNGDQYSDVAWAANRLPTDPGTSTWKHQTLVGITVDALTEAQIDAAIAKSINVYVDFGGSGSTREGVMASGRFIDVQRTIDFMEARINEAIAARLKVAPKVPYTNPGFAEIGGILDTLMQDFNDTGVLGPLLDSTTGELFRVTIPRVEDQSAADRAVRLAVGFIVEGQIAGAIHKVTGTVNVNV